MAQAAKATGEKESERDQRKRVAELDADAIQAENLSKMASSARLHDGPA